MLEKLTKEQEKLMHEVREEWIDLCLNQSGPIENLRESIDWLYTFSELTPPQKIVQCGSPMECQTAANEANGNSKDKLEYYSWFLWGLGGGSYWMAWADFWTRIGIINDPDCNKFIEIMRTGIWDMILFDEMAIVCQRPTKVCLEDERTDGRARRLHNLKGPAVEWSDGWKNYFIMGTDMNKYAEQIEDPSTVTAQMILTCDNVEQRKGLIDVIGYARFLELFDSIAENTGTDFQGNKWTLHSMDVGEATRWKMLEVTCPSKGCSEYMWVPPEMTNYQDAVAWSFGMNVLEYKPLVET